MLSFTVRPIAGASALCIALAAALTLMMTTPTAMAASLQDDDHVDLPGMGLSELDPEGTPFVLPEGLTIEDPIGGYNTSDPETATTNTPTRPSARASRFASVWCSTMRPIVRSPCNFLRD